MKGILGCPYCGGEVEMVRLADSKRTGKRLFRIECRKCRALVARGTKFENETEKDAKERIEQYDAIKMKY